jgi:hypothetical protein
MDNSFGLLLLTSVQRRLAHRVSSLLQVLHDPSYSFDIERMLGQERLTSAALKKFAKEQAYRLEAASDSVSHHDDGSVVEEVLNCDDEEVIDNPEAQSEQQPVSEEIQLQEALLAAVTKTSSSSTNEQVPSWDTNFQPERTLHLGKGGRGRILSRLYEHMMSITPTSV